MLWLSGSKKNLFQLNKLVQRWSFHSIYEAWVAYEMRKGVVQLYIKNNEVIFSLAWNIIFFDNFKSSCFEIFGDKERDIFEPKSWWKYDIYWLLKSSCFELFGDGKYDLFLSQEVDGKMIFSWSFWAFHNIPGLGKYGFSCSDICTQLIFFFQNLLIDL